MRLLFEYGAICLKTCKIIYFRRLSFEKSRRFGGIQPNSGPGDHSHLSCSAGDTQLGAGFWPGSARALAIMRRRREDTNWPRSLSIEDDPAAAKPATPWRGLRWTFRAKRACVVITDAEPDRLAPLTPPAPMGLRGGWVVAARCCASPPARSTPQAGRGTSAGDRDRSGGRVLGQAQHSGELAPLTQAEDPMRVASTKRSVESSMRRPALPRGA